MKPEKVFKRYDIRGKTPEEIDQDFARQLGRAVSQFASNSKNKSQVVVCKDTKQTSKKLKDSLTKGITRSGIGVVDVGTGPTDYAAYCSQKINTVGVMVTSSHMPVDFNGFKLIYSSGTSFVNEDLENIQEIFLSNSQQRTGGNGTARQRNLKQDYVSDAVQTVESETDGHSRKVVLDTCGGAASEVLPQILRHLGHKVNTIKDNETEGVHHDPPNAKPEIMQELKNQVDQTDADMGIGTDLDADRVLVYNGKEWITGEQLFFCLAQKISGDAVASVDTPYDLEEYVENMYYTKVGDPFVLNKMHQKDAELSGEPNGHYCLPEFTNYNSGSLIGALIASSDLDQLLENTPGIVTTKKKVETQNKKAAVKQFKQEVKSSEQMKMISEKDGVKFQKGESTILVRPSGSSPVVRIYSNSGEKEPSEEAAQAVYSKLSEHV